MSISSVEDFEDDEEELLQRALEEQAHRNLQYGRPGNHPPPLVSRAAAGPPARNPPPAPPTRRPPPPLKPQPPPDDESDVEMLSLSSEDDEPRPSSAPRPPRIDPDLDNDDEEPDCWKRVDENELSRMVREMRETKLTVLNLRRAPTYKRKASIVSEGYPRGDDFMDPLGLGVVDLRSLTLVKEKTSSVKDEGGKLSSAKDPSFKDKIMYYSENFEPKLFLSHIHQNTSHSELEAGEHSLKLDLQQRKQQLKLLVKDNFDCFVSCKNTVDDIHLKLQQIEADIEGAGTVHLSSSIYEVNKVANQAFGPLFERQVQAERIRSVQGMLQRFRTLFNLPSTIRDYITRREYDLAVREYKKAKSLVLPTHVRVLKTVLEEVEKVISEFKGTMYKSMEDSNMDLSQLESTIRLLFELEPASDPVWHYLTIQNVRIRSLLEGCSVEHEERMEELHKQSSTKAQLDARWKKIQHESTKSDVNYTSLFGEQDEESLDLSFGESAAKQSDALLSRLIRRLSMVVMQQVPPFWQLAVAVFNGKFAKVSPGGFTNISGQEIASIPGSDPSFQGHSLKEVVGMIVDILTLYENKVLNAFLALSEADILGPHMRNAIEEVSKVCLALESKETAPSSAVQVLFSLKLQIARHFILRLCSFMQTTSSKLETEEEWVPVSSIERSGSEFAISALPLYFQKTMVSRIDEIKEMLQRLKLERFEVVDLSTQVHQMEDSVKSTFFNSFFSLREILDKLALSVSQHCQELENKAVNDGNALSEHHFAGLQAGVAVANPHQRLLMILSNAGYCKTTLLPDLLQEYQHIWNGTGGEDSASNMLEDLNAAFSSLEESILGQYTRLKATLIGTAAAAFFLEDVLQWGAAPPVKGIRDGAVGLLHPLVAVHAELYAGAKPYLSKALPILIEGLIDALLNVFNENKLKALRVIDLNGFSQLALEISYLEVVLQSHFTAAAQDALSSLRNQLKEKVLETIREAETLGHRRSTARGVHDGSALEEMFQSLSVSAEELTAMEQQVCADFLQLELKRTRLITMCFTNAQSVQEVGSVLQSNARHYPTRSVNMASSTFNQRTPNSPGSNLSRHRRLLSASSLSDSDSGKPSFAHPSQSPLSQSGYASSDLGSESGVHEMQTRSSATSRGQSRRAVFGTVSDDFR